MKKTMILWATLALAGAVGLARASVVTYPSLDVNVTLPGGAAGTADTSVVNISTAPDDHRYHDPNSGTPQPSANRYYGGSVEWTGSANIWGSHAQFWIDSGTNPNRILQFRVGGGEATWKITWTGGSNLSTTLPFSSSSFDFVFKFEDTAWNGTSIKLFLNANANSPTEPGTADYTINVAGPTGADYMTTMQWKFSHESWDGQPATLKTSKMFSANEWTPVSSIPEPSSAMLLALAAVGVGARRLRRRN